MQHLPGCQPDPNLPVHTRLLSQPLPDCHQNPSDSRRCGTQASIPAMASPAFTPPIRRAACGPGLLIMQVTSREAQRLSLDRPLRSAFALAFVAEAATCPPTGEGSSARTVPEKCVANVLRMSRGLGFDIRLSGFTAPAHSRPIPLPPTRLSICSP